MLVQRDKSIICHIEKYGGLTIYQCAKIFFKDAKHSYDLARKRLRKIYDMGLIKYYTNRVTNERVYYLDKKLSPHDLYVMDFYAMLVYNNATINEFKKEPRWLNGKYRSDAFIKFSYNGLLRICIVEVDLTHNTNLDKYQEVYDGGEIQSVYGGFPMVCVIGDRDIIPTNDDFEIVGLTYNLSNFGEKVLSL